MKKKTKTKKTNKQKKKYTQPKKLRRFGEPNIVVDYNNNFNRCAIRRGTALALSRCRI